MRSRRKPLLVDLRQRWRLHHAERQNFCCYYCGRAFTRHGFGACTLDHKTPLSRGGDDKPNNTCAACGQCNQLKGDMTEREFMRRSR